jgi:hypothetical protein
MTPDTRQSIDRPRYGYPGYHGRPAECRLRIFRPGPDRPVVVVASEVPDNPGTSITNRVEVLAGLVAREFGIDPAGMLWVEHYPAGGGRREAVFRLVEFRAVGRSGELCKPAWHTTSRAAVERLVGGPLPD